MYKKIAILGDIHEQKKFPYHQSTSDMFEYLLSNNEINNEETLLICLGDIFDDNENSGSINHNVVSFFNSLKNKHKIVLEGNHDGSIDDSALEVLNTISGVEIIRNPMIKNLGGKQFLLLPHIYTDKNGTTLEDRYSNLYKEEGFDIEFDYCLYHVMDETKSFHKKSKVCDLSKLNIKKRIAGHDHNYNLDTGGNYLGSVQPNSSTEKDKKPKAYIIDLENNKDYTIDLPLFINYYTITITNY